MLPLTEEAKLCTNTTTYSKFANNIKFQSFNAVSNEIGTFPFLSIGILMLYSVIDACKYG